MWLTTDFIVNLLTMFTTGHIDRDRSTNYFETGWFADLKVMNGKLFMNVKLFLN